MAVRIQTSHLIPAWFLTWNHIPVLRSAICSQLSVKTQENKHILMVLEWYSIGTLPIHCSCCVASVVSDSVWPHRQQPTRLPHPWDSPGKNTGVGHHFLLQCMKVRSESEVTQLCPTLCDPMDCSLPGSPVHGIFQARVLEWIATAFSNQYTTMCIIDSQWEGAL